jgi:hypothetical protein
MRYIVHILTLSKPLDRVNWQAAFISKLNFMLDKK